MAATPLEFATTVDAWVKATERRMLAVFHESTQRVVRQAQSGIPGIPIDTGFARASVRASLDSMPPIDPNMGRPEKPGREPHSGILYSPDDGTIVLTINAAGLGQPIYVGWTANYVEALEAGSSQQAPSGFIRLAALQWPQIVAGVVEDAKARVG